jgi:hypothetical protein
MTFFKWSRIAANNATADSTCPFPEGMAASALNDGTRGMMAAASKYQDDIAGAIVTGGSSTAYTVFSYEGFDTRPHLDGQMIAFSRIATTRERAHSTWTVLARSRCAGLRAISWPGRSWLVSIRSGPR